jgi:diacylglycerol kinase
MRIKLRIYQFEQWVETKFQNVRSRRFHALRAKLDTPHGLRDPSQARSRIDAATGAIYSFPFMLWTARSQIWKEQAFQVEVGALILGSALGWLRGFGQLQWLLLGVLGGLALIAEANNTACEITLRRIQSKFFGQETLLDIDIGDLFEFAALPVAMCAYPWGILWVIFMIDPI